MQHQDKTFSFIFLTGPKSLLLASYCNFGLFAASEGSAVPGVE